MPSLMGSLEAYSTAKIHREDSDTNMPPPPSQIKHPQALRLLSEGIAAVNADISSAAAYHSLADQRGYSVDASTMYIYKHTSRSTSKPTCSRPALLTWLRDTCLSRKVSNAYALPAVYLANVHMFRVCGASPIVGERKDNGEVHVYCR